MEWCIQTLKEQCLYVHQFTSLEEARELIEEIIQRYNSEWLIERPGYRTRSEVRTPAAWAEAAEFLFTVRESEREVHAELLKKEGPIR